MPPPGKPPVPQKPWDGHGFNLSKKAVLGIIAIIIIVAILLGAYFLYPMISDSDGVNPDNGTAVVSTNTTNPGMATTPVGTQKPATTATYRPGPGNSGSRVGL
jgi:hypothetical protein